MRVAHKTESIFECPKCGWEYRSPIKGTSYVSHPCPETFPKSVRCKRVFQSSEDKRAEARRKKRAENRAR